MPKTGLRTLAALLLLGVSGAAARAAPELPEVDFIRVDKGHRTMTLYAAGAVVRIYRGIQLGGNPIGPKHFEGDKRTPEGRYTIDYGNEDSSYHIALHISYPNAADRAYAAAYRRAPGGLIMIHGQPNDWPLSRNGGRVPGDWTDGCIALSNAQVEELWQTVPDGTAIEIAP